MDMSLIIDLMIGKGHILVISKDRTDHIPIHMIGVIGVTQIEAGG